MEQNKVTYNLRSTKKISLKEGEAIKIQDPKTQKWNITDKVKEAVSYTHLTLPTTPYV